MAFRVAFSIDPRILAAGDLVAESRGVPRKDLFRSTPTERVIAEAVALLSGVDAEHVLSRAPEIPDLLIEYDRAAGV